MRRSRSLLVLLLAGTASSIVACGGAERRPALSYGDHARVAYEEALADLRDENCLDAEPAFRSVRRQYPYSRYAALAELRLADCLFIQSKYPEAIQAYRQFVRQRPSHAEVPYARFKVAEAYFEQIPDDWLLSPPAHELDQGPTREALRQLRRFLTDFPEDPRAARVRRMSQDTLALLGRHELYVAEFYLERGHAQAAVRRLESLLEAYAGSGIEPSALLLLGRTYLELSNRVEARRVLSALVERFPRSGEAAEARAQLAAAP